jgi:colanic acid/amylovoran biosynthesis glycosyltransferase
LPTKDSSTRRLIIIPPMGAPVLADGARVMPAKLIEGISFFARAWGSSNAEVWHEVAAFASNDLDNRPWLDTDLPCRFKSVDIATLVERDDSEFADALFLVNPDYRLRPLLLRLAQLGIPYVIVTELSLLTQLQIASVSNAHLWKRFKSMAWVIFRAQRMRKILANASALQCNGTPTYDAYRDANPNRLLFFDTRTKPDMLARPEDIERKSLRHRQLGKIRLLFSGRLIAIKGVGHLVDVAQGLKQRGVAFELLVAGDGQLRESMFVRVKKMGLANEVRYLGVLDFATELMPMLRTSVDLFVCPHLQGDPSCTYLETMGAGVPIVGYANEAFSGVCRASGSGWVVPRLRPDLLAEKIAELQQSPELLHTASLRALEFAAQHTFDKVFTSRVNHLQRIAQGGTSEAN